MKYLYLVRHGQTLFNQQHKIQGWCDSPLTDKGILQAQAIGKYFKKNNIKFDYAYCSTSERANDTLEYITDMTYTRLKGLKEMNYGLLEGQDESLGQNDPIKCETYYLQFNGESSLTTRKRITDTLIDIINKDNHNNVLVVSHGGAIFNFLKGINADLSYLNKGSSNGAIFVLEYMDNKFNLIDVIFNPVQ